MEETACFKPAWPAISQVLLFFPILQLLVFFFLFFFSKIRLNFMKLLVAEIKYIVQITYIIDVKYKNGIYNT